MHKFLFSSYDSYHFLIGMGWKILDPFNCIFHRSLLWIKILSYGQCCVFSFRINQNWLHAANWTPINGISLVKSELDTLLTDHNWKNDFFVECLSPILEAMTNTARPPDYTYILGLDKSVRDFAVPSLLEEQNTKVTPRFLIMQRGLVVMGREIGLFSYFSCLPFRIWFWRI